MDSMTDSAPTQASSGVTKEFAATISAAVAAAAVDGGGGEKSNNEHSSATSEAASVALKKGPWTSAEDAILVAYVSKHGEGNWNNVQKHSGLSRCGKSCRLRWANHLRPNLKKGAFTPEEERLIIELHAKLGNKWARMAAQLPGRTDNEIKNYWNTRIKRRLRAGLPVYPSDVHSLVNAGNVNNGTNNSNNNNSGSTNNHPDPGYSIFNSAADPTNMVNANGGGPVSVVDSPDCDAVSSSPSSCSKLRTHVNLATLHGNSTPSFEYDSSRHLGEMEGIKQQNFMVGGHSPIILRRASSKRLRESGSHSLELYHHQQQQQQQQRYRGEYPPHQKGYVGESPKVFLGRDRTYAGGIEFSAESPMYGDSSLGSNSGNGGGSMLLEALLQEARMMEGDAEQQLLLLNNNHHAADDVVVTMMDQQQHMNAAGGAAGAGGVADLSKSGSSRSNHLSLDILKFEQQELWGDQEILTSPQVCCVFSEESMNGNPQHWDESSGIVEQSPLELSARATPTNTNTTTTAATIPAAESVSMDEDVARGNSVTAAAAVYTDEEISTLLDFARADTVPLNLDWEEHSPENETTTTTTAATNNNNNNNNSCSSNTIDINACSSLNPATTNNGSSNNNSRFNNHHHHHHHRHHPGPSVLPASAPPGFLPFGICNSSAESTVADAFEAPDLFGPVVEMELFGGASAAAAAAACIWEIGCPSSPWSSMPGATQLPCDDCKPLAASSVADPCPIY